VRARPGGEPDAESGGGQLEYHLPRSLQLGDLGRAELLKLGEDALVGVRALPAGPAERGRAMVVRW
jgi:hypothetical protein